MACSITYGFLGGVLDYIEFNNKEHDLDLNIKVLKLVIECDRYDYDDRLFWRFHQYPIMMKYPELIEIFRLSSYMLTKNLQNMYEGIVNNNIDNSIFKDDESYERLLNDNMTHITLKNLINTIKDEIEQDGYKDVYNKIRLKIGDIIFEEIRYDLNPLLGDYITEVYDILLNNSGNLDNKELFKKCTCLESVDHIKLVLNVLHLAKHYGLYRETKEEVFNFVLNGQFKELYEKYINLLDMNPNFQEVQAIVDAIEYEDSEIYNREWIKDSMHKLNYRYDYISAAEENLYIIVNGEKKFLGTAKKRKQEGTPEDPQPQMDDILKELKSPSTKQLIADQLKIARTELSSLSPLEKSEETPQIKK